MSYNFKSAIEMVGELASGMFDDEWICEGGATFLTEALTEAERLQAENATLKRALELACDYLADNNASKVDWQKHFTEKAKEESENG